jgi:hypothetical protein
VSTNRIWRQANLDLLCKVMEHINDGHFNNDIRALLAGILDAEGCPSLQARVIALPDRTVCGVQESWCLAALQTFCQEEKARLEAVLRSGKENQ